ncbi:MAG: type I methionyl aminopeptidase [SAR202 cluster bacterium]|nr:type I methionyl aminopeptidase [SAR202 cluster bacterium]|tara:strand:- start:12626 stop:13372 length:747 start_codon:yes stop_codon:yes gene_type:complete
MSGITIKSSSEIKSMRYAGQILVEAKKILFNLVEPGITTIELDTIAESTIRKLGGIPGFKGLYGFPATICASVNEEIVHGIPSKRILQEGDILSIDIGAIVDGMNSDSAFTMGVGQIGKDEKDLIENTKKSLDLGIAQVKSGARVGDISFAIQSYAEGLGYGVVKKYVGHGIGRELHEEPQVPNYGPAGRGPILREGMAIAIEPMLNLGHWDTQLKPDGWTVVTADGSLSAHFEDTIVITENGSEILT